MLKIFFVKSQNCWTRLGWVLIWPDISFPLFINQLILDGNPTTYCLKYWFSDIGSFAFSNQYKICNAMICNITKFDKIDSLPLRMLVTESLKSPKFWEGHPVLKVINFVIFSWSNVKTTAPKFGSWTLPYWPYYCIIVNFSLFIEI